MVDRSSAPAMFKLGTLPIGADPPHADARVGLPHPELLLAPLALDVRAERSHINTLCRAPTCIVCSSDMETGGGCAPGALA